MSVNAETLIWNTKIWVKSWNEYLKPIIDYGQNIRIVELIPGKRERTDYVGGSDDVNVYVFQYETDKWYDQCFDVRLV